MPYLRSVLGVLLLMIALASANQLSVSQIFNFDPDTTDQSDDSDDQQGDQVVSMDDFLVQKRFALLTPEPLENPSEIVSVESEKPAVTLFSRAVPCLLPTRLFISRSGLLPRAP